jgi:putative sterol carrier protein
MSTNTEEYKKATQGWNNLIEQSIKGLADLIRTETKNGFWEALEQHSTKSNQDEKADENLLTRTQSAKFLNVVTYNRTFAEKPKSYFLQSWSPGLL